MADKVITSSTPCDCCGGLDCELICSYCEDGYPDFVMFICGSCETPYPEGWEEFCSEGCEAITHCEECDCNPLPPETCIECRVKSASAIHCGFPDYSHYPDAQKWYRKITLEGSIEFRQYTDSDCTNFNGGTRFMFSGTCEYSSVLCADGATPGDCVLTDDGQRNVANAIDESTWETGSNYSGCGLSFGDYSFVVGSLCSFEETSSSVKTVTGLDDCINTNPGVWRKATGSATQTLFDEETLDSIFDRLSACIPFSDWGSTCPPATKSDPGGGTSSWAEVQWRIRKDGLLASTSYDFTVTYWRRAVGAPDWTLYSTMDLTDVTDGTGLLETASVDIPNELGYETEARCDCVFTPTPPP